MKKSRSQNTILNIDMVQGEIAMGMKEEAWG